MTEADHIRTAAASLDDPRVKRWTADCPAFICGDCGRRYGRRQAGVCTMHHGLCGICGDMDMVTEPRDWGHLRDGWQRHRTLPAVAGDGRATGGG